jgi:hypothetical protein
MLVKKIGQEAFEIKCDQEELIKILYCVDTEIRLTYDITIDPNTEQERNLQNYYDQLTDIYTTIDVELNQDNKNAI